MKKLTAIFVCVLLLAALSGGRTEAANGGGMDDNTLIGPWRGALDGFSFYFMFRDDGTFSYLTQMPNSQNYTLIRGNWRLSEDIVYMTDITMLGWNGSDTPPNGSVWTSIEDDFLQIRFSEDEEAKEYGLPYRKMEILSIVSDSPYNKGATLTVRHENLPSWAYLGD